MSVFPLPLVSADMVCELSVVVVDSVVVDDGVTVWSGLVVAGVVVVERVVVVVWACAEYAPTVSSAARTNSFFIRAIRF